MDSPKLFVVDDETEICELLKDIGESCGYTVETATTAESFRNRYVEFSPDMIFLDLHLGDKDGIELLRFLAENHSETGIVLMSGYGGKVLSSSLELGKNHGLKMKGSFQKPIKVAVIQNILDGAKSNTESCCSEKLASAIENGALILHYQPKIDLKSKKVIGAEALVRWPAEGSKLIYPDDFIGLAEQKALIKPLTHLVLKKAFQQMAAWKEKNIDLSVAVNLSPKVLDALVLPDEIAEMANEYGIEASKVILEITETAVMSQAVIALDILTRFRLKGFMLAIDDFGTGYSSLTELYRMPFSEIKIDKSFVMKMMVDDAASVIAHSIIDLGHNLGLTVTAEGVETREAEERLADLKCDVAQGYYISRPIVADDFERWLKDKKY